MTNVYRAPVRATYSVELLFECRPEKSEDSIARSVAYRRACIRMGSFNAEVTGLVERDWDYYDGDEWRARFIVSGDDAATVEAHARHVEDRARELGITQIEGAE